MFLKTLITRPAIDARSAPYPRLANSTGAEIPKLPDANRIPPPNRIPSIAAVRTFLCDNHIPRNVKVNAMPIGMVSAPDVGNVYILNALDAMFRILKLFDDNVLNAEDRSPDIGIGNGVGVGVKIT